MDHGATLSIDGLNVRVWGRGDVPALVFHGGPGSGLNMRHTSYFDAERHRVVLFDQRGTGRSGTPGVLVANTTQHTLHNAEAIRIALGIDDWIVVGGSWGGALALAYAAAHPDRVRGLVVRSAHISHHAQQRWVFGERARIHEAGALARDLFLDPLDPVERDDPGTAWFARMMTSDEQAHEAARRVNALEQAFHGPEPGTVRLDPKVSAHDVARARVYLWYWVNRFFLPQDGPADPTIIARLPHWMIHGTHDLICPIDAARFFARLGGLRFHELPGAGHDGLAPMMTAAVRYAVEELSG